uniref:L,D-TPase catalytic domain-containing protein n=1 Tax=Eubacterium cellulosolvens (strain ATCC 43171 / JCM 9499 / 6) TaxID=633697 RepID=I5ASL9_EUBC6
MRIEKLKVFTVGRQLRLCLIALVTVCVVLFFGLVNVFASDDPGMLADPPTAEATVASSGETDGQELQGEDEEQADLSQTPDLQETPAAQPSESILPEETAGVQTPSGEISEGGTASGDDIVAADSGDGKNEETAEDAENPDVKGEGNEEADEEVAKTVTKVILYRMFHPVTCEHFYTSSVVERNALGMAGWKYEGIGWTSPSISDTPVYRLFSTVLCDHHYTTSSYERDELVKNGWRDEGIGWYSDDAMSTPIYRQFNSKLYQGSHNFTNSQNEAKTLVTRGWRDEGIAWYGMLDPDPEILYPMTIADGVDYSKVYNYEYYKTHYTDVTSRLGDSDGALLNHFVTQGMRELRTGNGVFYVKSYIYEYKDLRKLYKDNYKKYYAHYCTNGYKENRHVSGCTSLKNPDYKYAGVDFSPIFDYNYYVSHYASIVKSVGFTDYTLVEYFAKNGLKKNQKAKDSYNTATYNKIKEHFYPSHDDMYYVAQQFSSATNWLILCNRGQRIVQVYTGSRGNWTENRKIVCDVGAPATPTITGQYALGAKMLYFLTGECRCWYASQIYGDYLFHSVIYDGQSSPVRVVDGTLGAAVSHGCVRMDIKDAKYIYDNVPSGTKIYIYN